MTEAGRPDDGASDAGDEQEPSEPYTGPDPEEDEKGDGSDEDQGT